MDYLRMLWRRIANNPVRRRWADLAVLFAVVFGLTWCLRPYLLVPLKAWAEWVNRQGLFAYFFFGVGAWCLLGLLMFHVGALNRRWESFITHIRYPPSLLVGVGLSGVFFSLAWISEYSDGIPWWELMSCLCSTVAIASIGLVVGLLLPDLHSSASCVPSDNRHDPVQKFGPVTDWALTDNPVSDPTADMFSSKVVAERLASKVARGETTRAVVAGRFGAGKSSVLKMTEYYLLKREDRQRSVHVWLDGWGRDVGSIDQQVLRGIVEKVTQVTDLASVNDLPETYRTALGKAPGTCLNVLADLCHLKKDPVEELHRLDSILEAIQYQVVVFIEDTDRNSEAGRVATELAGLMDRLRDCEHISILLAIGVECNTVEPFLRLCDWTEQLPPSPPTVCLSQILRKFREEQLALEVCSGDTHFVTTLDEARRLVARLRVDSDVEPITLDTMIDAACSLIRSPRMLKRVLMRTHSVWQTLHGEISFDDVLLANVLRYGAPDAFVFVSENVADLRRRHFSSAGASEVLKRLDNRWAEVTKDKDWDGNAAREVAGLLFPAWSMSGIAVRPETTQGVAGHAGTDYWDRYLRESLLENEVGDQELLRWTDEWKTAAVAGIHTASRLPKELARNHEIAAKCHCCDFFMLDGDDLLRLAGEVFDEARREYGASAHSKVIAGFGVLRDAVKGRGIGAGYEEWIGVQIERSVPVSLSLTNDIYCNWWLDLSHGTSMNTTAVRRRMVNAGRKAFEGRAESLLAVLSPADIFAVVHYALKFDLPDFDGGGFRVEEWRWLWDTVLAALELAPQNVAAHVAVTVVRPDDAGCYKLEEEFLKKAFPAKEDIVMRRIADGISVEGDYAPNANVLIKARSEALRWLEAKEKREQSSSTPDDDHGQCESRS